MLEQKSNFKKSVSTIGDAADFGTELDSKVEEWLKGEIVAFQEVDFTDRAEGPL